MIGKILLAFVVVLAITMGVYTFNRGGDTQVTEDAANQFFDVGSGRRGDDPLYSEEIRKNTALTLEARDRADRLTRQLEQIKRDKQSGEQQTARILQQATAQIKQLNQQVRDLSNAKADADNSGAYTQEMQKQFEEKFQEISNKMDMVTQAAQQKSEQDQAKIAKLEAALLQTGQETASTADTETMQQKSQSAITYAYGRGRVNENEQGVVDKISGSISSGISGLFDEDSGGINYHGDDKVPTFRQPKKEKEWETVFPVYTLPPNTVLANSTLLTPIIGRVPLFADGGSNVTDPFYFKVSIGADNLAANNQNIPGVAKMIASGYATGIREQSCVRGYIDSLTFIFVDGRIVTHGGTSQDGTSNSQALGYLADQWGKPCIRGTYINNAKDYLMTRGLAAFIESAAQGLSQSQVSTQRNTDGSYQAILDGNVWSFILGQGISGSAGEVAQYVRDRTANAFDVVYVEQSKPVQIWLNTMIPIDYDAKARKINYYAEPATESLYD